MARRDGGNCDGDGEKERDLCETKTIAKEKERDRLMARREDERSVRRAKRKLAKEKERDRLG
uniref:Uncharacterized protein n=1 Tax=Cucumis melo TaxID=3656 RepID=A0A9I9CCC2_CUCME